MQRKSTRKADERVKDSPNTKPNDESGQTSKSRPKTSGRQKVASIKKAATKWRKSSHIKNPDPPESTIPEDNFERCEDASPSAETRPSTKRARMRREADHDHVRVLEDTPVPDITTFPEAEFEFSYHIPSQPQVSKTT